MGSENAVRTGAVQAGTARKHVQGARAVVLITLGLGGLLGGCSSVSKTLNPVQWWHGLQGGAIAEQRPAPPGADDPYPNLASVPARPPASDPKLRQQIADALIADRDNAQHDAGSVQQADPSNPVASPTLFGRGSVPLPVAPPAAALAGGASQARLVPVTPPAMATERPTGVARVPVGNVTSAPLEEPRSEAPTRLPLPLAPPAPANLPGAPTSAPVPAPSQTSVIPTTTVAPSPTSASTAAAGPAVGVPFTLGSATVPRTSLPALRQLAARRKVGTIAITGYGEAAGSDTAEQSAALLLALARAQAVAAALTTAGVPANALRIDAEAAGRGAVARLVE